ncbi:tRNA dihydrouridine(20/20a) synthase DusA [Xaviernesmea oryzae]|uniref:tRNA-dihydrouridine(20/20a) synthase n=1 Tax=Xaviernesmea oryzae TaxID=464029 RepID=A0A1Q9B0K1_9HYPH|nr:tRNA dihydrouridine(20/20a) synthase DusA [Xaviernesmea oryzae]OLP61464.1 tRNA dihydrouridine(20/20a) synthase DusA [Xaviernesmea oryzae]SEL68492.1 tRNA-dihydrouridine synthase A [Xaviernesmea oryzae]
MKAHYFSAPVFAVAPMIDWTDRHFRSFARTMTRHALLYTEMIVADAVLRGDRQRLLGMEAPEHPVALQLGGNDPAKLAEAARIAVDFGYAEINLNVGCPSDRVQSGIFGACLMLNPALVADCVAAMKAAVALPVTVKCRIGVDQQEPEEALRGLIDAVSAAGADAVWVHARKAWLEGLSPKENREIPPLDYDLVSRVKAERPQLFMGLNGGLQTLDAALGMLDQVDGVMLGRAAYHDSGLLSAVDAAFPGLDGPSIGQLAPAQPLTPRGHRADPAFWQNVAERMADYAGRHLASGGRLIHVTRHMVGLFQGWPGARRYRQILSSEAAAAGAGPEVILKAFAAVLGGEEQASIGHDGLLATG